MAVAQGVLPFKVELTDSPEALTAWARLPVVVELMRKLFGRRLYRALSRALGYKRWRTVRRHLESVVLLVLSGGEHLRDLDVLRADQGLRVLLGFKLSSPTQAKDFLYRFHQDADGRWLTPEQDQHLSHKGDANVRAEGPALSALETMVRAVFETMQSIRPSSRATLDVDATIVEAHKKTALRAYEGTVGYQPQMAWWAEQGLWVCDEFRDGNVPAAFEVQRYLERAFGALPGDVRERRLRADSAFYDERALSWANEHCIAFAVSADMSHSLSQHIQVIGETEYKPYRNLAHDDPHEERQWAEVPDFVPGWNINRNKDGQPLRYIAIRVRSRQRELLESEREQWRHFAVVTNMDWEGERLLRWHREKQGTVEHAHGVVKNDLGGGVLPSGRFGANAAWWRLNVLAHNLLELLKRQALPDELGSARPQTLRFRFFQAAGRVVRHARRWTLKLFAGLPWAKAFIEARRCVLQLTPALSP